MTYMVLRDSFPVRAAATVGAITDLEQFVRDTPGMEDLTRQIWPDYETNKQALLVVRLME